MSEALRNDMQRRIRQFDSDVSVCKRKGRGLTLFHTLKNRYNELVECFWTEFNLIKENLDDIDELAMCCTKSSLELKLHVNEMESTFEIEDIYHSKIIKFIMVYRSIRFY